MKTERNGTKRLCSWCSQCSSESATEKAKIKRQLHGDKVRKEDRERYRKNREKIRLQADKRRKTFKQKCVDYLGSECNKCGYKKSLAALDFHHRNGDGKNIHITRGTVNWKEIKAELDKCDLLCANCHRESHWITLDAV